MSLSGAPALPLTAVCAYTFWRRPSSILGVTTRATAGAAGWPLPISEMTALSAMPAMSRLTFFLLGDVSFSASRPAMSSTLPSFTLRTSRPRLRRHDGVKC